MINQIFILCLVKNCYNNWIILFVFKFNKKIKIKMKNLYLTDYLNKLSELMIDCNHKDLLNIAKILKKAKKK